MRCFLNALILALACFKADSAITNGVGDRVVAVAVSPVVSDGQDSWILSNNAFGTGRLLVGANIYLS